MMTITLTLDATPTPQEISTAREVLRVLDTASLKASAISPEEIAARLVDSGAAGSTDEAARAFGAVLPPVPPAPPADPVAPIFDQSGLPWDDRIHSSTKAKNQDGSWKKKRGVQDSEVTRIETELRLRTLATTAPAAAPTLAPTPVTVAPVAPAAPPPPPAVVSQAPSVPLQQTVAPPTPPPPTPAAPGAMTFIEFVQKMSPLLSSGKITQATLVDACKTVGLESLPLLAQRPDLIPQVDAYVAMLTAG